MKIKKYRAEKGLTQEQLAVLAGLTVKTVWRAENGLGVTKITLERLAAALGVQARDLL